MWLTTRSRAPRYYKAFSGSSASLAICKGFRLSYKVQGTSTALLLSIQGAVILILRPLSMSYASVQSAYTRLCVSYAYVILRPLSMSFYASVRSACTRPYVLYTCIVLINRPLSMSFYASVQLAYTRLYVSYACVILRPLSMSYASVQSACTRPCVSYACIILRLLVLERSFVVRHRCLRGPRDPLYTPRQKFAPGFKGELILMSRAECKVFSANSRIDTRRIN